MTTGLKNRLELLKPTIVALSESSGGPMDSGRKPVKLPPLLR